MSHEHSAETESLDEANATALVTMEGLGLFCFTDRGTYEGGFLHLPPRHVLSLTITGEETPRPTIHVKGDVTIEVVNPVQEGMHRYEKGDFNRQAGESNDPNDFRWIADVEGQEFHDVELGKRHGPGLRRLLINAATIYTKAVRAEEFVVVRVDTTGVPCRFYGKQARVVGATLESGAGGGVRVRIDGPGGQEIWLPKKEGDPYGIIFDNDCDIRPNPSHSDFLLFYEVLSDTRGIKYDLIRAQNSGPPDTRCTSQTIAPKHKDGMGIACDNGYLRHTSSLPD